MDCIKVGKLISQFRKEKNLTQQMLADALNISNKTVSKWECGLGCPDTSLWSDLSLILGVDISQVMNGEITPNKPDIGNINNIRFYVCQECNNVLTSTGSASIHCCGRKLEQAIIIEDNNKPTVNIELSDIDYYITFDHSMTRDNYILFVANVNLDKVYLTRLYPEQSPSVRVPYQIGGKIFLYSTKYGLYKYDIKEK